MKHLAILFILSGCILFSCKKEPVKSQKIILLTSHTWTSDSLLVDKVDASDPGEKLEKFKGDMKFKESGTGTFADYSVSYKSIC